MNYITFLMITTVILATGDMVLFSMITFLMALFLYYTKNPGWRKAGRSEALGEK